MSGLFGPIFTKFGTVGSQRLAENPNNHQALLLNPMVRRLTVRTSDFICCRCSCYIFQISELFRIPFVQPCLAEVWERQDVFRFAAWSKTTFRSNSANGCKDMLQAAHTGHRSFEQPKVVLFASLDINWRWVRVSGFHGKAPVYGCQAPPTLSLSHPWSAPGSTSAAPASVVHP